MTPQHADLSGCNESIVSDRSAVISPMQLLLRKQGGSCYRKPMAELAIQAPSNVGLDTKLRGKSNNDTAGIVRNEN